jgi:hypothetical protein
MTFLPINKMDYVKVVNNAKMLVSVCKSDKKSLNLFENGLAMQFQTGF